MSVIATLVAALALGAGAAAISLETPAAPPARSVAVVTPGAPVAPGQPVRLAARVPAVAGAAIAWDLDADGRFDDAAGPRAVARFAAAGRHRVAAVAVWPGDALPSRRTAAAQVAVSR
jgi:hypothetical protein